MDDDKIIITMNEMTWFMNQIGTVEAELGEIISKFTTLSQIVETDAKTSGSVTLYQGKAIDEMQMYVSYMKKHLSQLSDFLVLAIVFISNTIEASGYLDEEIQTAMNTIHEKIK